MCDKISLIGKTFVDLLALFMCEIENDDDYYDVISYNIAKYFPGRLEGLLKDISGNRLRGAICGLGLAGVNIEYVAPYLKHEDERVVCAAIDAMRRVGTSDGWLNIKHLLLHGSPYVRGAALRFARATLQISAMPFLIDALDDKDEIVRENALDELEGIATNDLKPRIEKLLNDESLSVQKAASSLLGSMKPA